MELPVGYFPFHKDPFINYQLNRWYSLGFTRREEIEWVGTQTKTFDDYTTSFIQLAEEAHAANRLKNAAFYYRAAEFLVEPHAPNKLALYQTFHDLFYQAFEEEDIERQLIAYQGSHIPAMRLAARGEKAKGTLLAFGGFDSVIEEFYALWSYFARAGYEVIAFEGPGQGAAIRLHGLPLDHDWEKPVSAILDHFAVNDATLVGVSMGGYWSVRAAAFEKRVRRVISFPPVYDWLEMTIPFNRILVDQLLKWPTLMNAMVRLKMMNGTLKHTVNQALFITQRDEPIDAVHWLLGMNKAHIHSVQVDQDVLLLGGANDRFQPPGLLYKQEQALVNARSVTTRIFTEAEHADQHCQIGNLGLALDVMASWLERVSEPTGAR